MSSPAAFGAWQGHGHAVQTPPPPLDNSSNEDGITVKPMRLKVLYTFDDQNKTNCLARWPHVLQIQTVMMDEGSTIGVIELRTCIQAIVQCSPELIARVGQDYTVYAYDYSEYDNPLVGQGMLSRVLHATSPTPEAPAQQSRQLVTGRVCKNILGLFANGVKETLEVKLRLVPVPTNLQDEFKNTMEKYREMNRSVPPPGFDATEWNSLLQSTPNFGAAETKHSFSSGLGQLANLGSFQREGMSMEVMNQLLSPSIPEPQMMESFMTEALNAPSPLSLAPPVAPNENGPELSTGYAKQTGSRPSSRASIKRPPKGKEDTPVLSGNPSGYEDGTDGEDLPVPKKRVKTIKATEWNQKSAFGRGADLRVAASTAGSLRLFRPIAISPAVSSGNHLQEVPRAPTPVPELGRKRTHASGQIGLRRDSFLKESSIPRLAFAQQSADDDELRYSIESAGPSPERQDTPADTPPEFGSSPPVMRTQPPSPMRSSPPCPTSPCLPPMPRTDSGFMSGTIDELFGDDEPACPVDDDEVEVQIPEPPKRKRSRPSGRQSSVARAKAPEPGSFQIEEPGPVELLPTRMPVHVPHKQPKPPKEKTKRSLARTASRASSVMSEDGLQSLPVLPPSLPPMVPGMPQLLPRPPMSSQQISQPPSSGQPTPPMTQQPRVMKNSKSKVQETSKKSTTQESSRVGLTALVETHPQQMARQFNPAPHLEHTAQGASISRESQTPQPTSQESNNTFPFQPQASIPRPTVQTSQGPVESTRPAQLDPHSIPSPSFSEPHQARRRPSVPAASAPAPEKRRSMVRTASLGSLSLPQVPASDPVLPPSSLHRSQTWSEAPHPMTEGPMPPMSDIEEVQMQDGSIPPPVANSVPYNRTWNAKKAAIRHKLETAILNGEMPPYCCNCGAIETPTWRKAWSQECQGAPGYYEYSDEPGKVTAIVILTRDSEGNPTSYQLIKKYLRADENVADFKEFILCNPCGIWMSKYKTQRPPERWENSMVPLEKKILPPRRPQYQRTSRAKKPGSKNSEPPVSFNDQTPMTHVPSPSDSTEMQSQSITTEEQRERSESVQPQKNSTTMTSEAASAALRRAIQSSPARWNGSRHSPIDLDVEDGDTTRRLLFPSPRKDGSPKILGELTTNVVQISPGYVKDQILDLPNKENCPPMIVTANEDEDLLRFFEEELARPATPLQKTPPTNPFKTPTRPTPNHRPITRSVSKSARKSPSHLLGLTPSRATPRRSPRNHNGEFVSPFTATLNQMMSEANSQSQSPSRNMLDGVELDFDNLPDLPLGNQDNRFDSSFSLEDFFSTDVPMPSSPPRAFRLYEDPGAGLDMHNIDWNEFQDFGRGLSSGAGAVEAAPVKSEPEPSPRKKNTPKKRGGKS